VCLALIPILSRAESKIVPSNLGGRNAEPRQRDRAPETASSGTVIPTFSVAFLTSLKTRWAEDILKVVFIGGAGFLGQLLIAEILKRTVLPDAQARCRKSMES
jgi:hypothetical protein